MCTSISNEILYLSSEVYLGFQLINAMKALCWKPLNQRVGINLWFTPMAGVDVEQMLFVSKRDALIDSYGVSISARTFYLMEKRICVLGQERMAQKHEHWANIIPQIRKWRELIWIDKKHLLCLNRSLVRSTSCIAKDIWLL